MSIAGRNVYLIPGRDESLDGRLGNAILNLGHSIQGREVASGFERLRFSQQLEIVRSDLEKRFWNPLAVLIGRSYRAYLLLHTLADMLPFPGKILLFSPVLGEAVATGKDLFFVSMQPRAQRLYQMAKDRVFPAPRYMEIHTGAEDNGCDTLLADKFASRIENTKLIIVPGMGHSLDQNYVRDVLVRFFNTTTLL